MKKSIKISVHHYIDATGLAMREIIKLAGNDGYLAEMNGRTYVVEVWG